MIVTAALCWWNEQPEDLTACVDSLAGLADRIVALDGAYARYPAATVVSPQEQVDAIKHAAARIGVESEVLLPDRLWFGQVEKRTTLLQEGAEGSDWVLMLDADHILHGDMAAVRRILGETRVDVVATIFHTPVGDRPLKDAAGKWHVEQTTLAPYIPQFYRALPGLQVQRKHWWVTAKKDGQWVWLWGGDAWRPRMPQFRLSPSDLWVEHRTLMRTEEQILASRAFLNDRAMVVRSTGQEDDQPELPRPVWDYITRPA